MVALFLDTSFTQEFLFLPVYEAAKQCQCLVDYYQGYVCYVLRIAVFYLALVVGSVVMFSE